MALVQATQPPENAGDKFKLRRFSIDLSKNVPRMLRKVRDTLLPEEDLCEKPCSTQGIKLNTLKTLRDEWLTKFDWEKEQASLNRSVNNYRG